MHFDRTRFHRACTVAALVAATAIVLPAQGTTATRTGVYGGAGLGWGWGREVTCHGCSDFFPNGATAYFEFGFTLNSHLRAGVQADLAAQNPYGRPLKSEFYMATATYYPSSTQGFWIEGAAGYGTGPSLIVVQDTVNQSTGTITFPHSGFALGLGVGYDIDPHNGDLRVVPFSRFLDQYTGTNGPGPLLLQFGVELAYKH